MGSIPVDVPARMPIDPVGAIARLATGLLIANSSAYFLLVLSLSLKNSSLLETTCSMKK